MIAIIVATVGVAIAGLLTLNALASYLTHQRPVLSLLRLQAAALAWLGLLVALEIERMVS